MCIFRFSVDEVHEKYVDSLVNRLTMIVIQDNSREMQVCKNFLARVHNELTEIEESYEGISIKMTNEEAAVLVRFRSTYYCGFSWIAEWSVKYGEMVYAFLSSQKLICELHAVYCENVGKPDIAQINLNWGNPLKILQCYSESINELKTAIYAFEKN